MQRSEIFRLRGPRSTVGHEQAGPRFGVVVQSHDLLALSTVLVAPTSRQASPSAFRPTIELGGVPTRVLADQLRSVDKRRLGESHGLLSFGDLEEIDRALLTVLGLDR